MHFLDKKIRFPHVSQASSDGLLAIGGDLSAERLIHAYQHGIFPWYEEGGPILWWSPDPRFVVLPEALKISKSMRTIIKKQLFKVTTNTAFDEVLQHCADIRRKDQDGTWITEEMIAAYKELHRLGYAKSLEVWQDNSLVGGLYGIDLANGVFCGESMFSLVSNASKLAFIHLVKMPQYHLIDCQIHTEHLESLGGTFMAREAFLSHLV